MAINRKHRSCPRFLKFKLTEKYDNPLLFATVEQNRLIMIISLASSESQPVSNFVDKTIIIKQIETNLKEDGNILFKKTSGMPGYQPLIKILEDYPRLF